MAKMTTAQTASITTLFTAAGLLGIAANHVQAGVFTQALWVIVLLLAFVQVGLIVRAQRSA